MQAFIRRDESGHHRILPQCYNLRDEAWASVRSVLDDIRGTVRNSESPPLPDIGSRSFEIECSGCHTSGARLRLDPASGNMQSHWRDGAIDCEACHGPGGEHAKAWRNLDAGTPMPRLDQLNRRAATAICARCHGGPPTGPGFAPSDAQHFVGVLEDRDGLFPNGTASGQIYQHAGFVRSPCEVGCSACHDPHEPSLRPTEHTDALCSRCHQEELSRAHTHHDMSGPGARCIECHMPKLLDGFTAHQRDHSISIPLPATPHAPDACTACHKDKTKPWAADAYRKWWGEPPKATLQAIEGVALARKGDPAATPLLRKALKHEDPFFRAAAAVYLNDPTSVFDDPVPEVRLAGVRAARNSEDPLGALQRFLKDPEPRIRAEAWAVLFDLGYRAAPDSRADLEIGVRQVRDWPLARIVLGSLELADGESKAAIRHFEEAIVFRPKLVDAWRGVANAYEAAGRAEEARHAHVRRAQLLTAALRSGNTSKDVLSEAVAAYIVAGHPERARSVLREALRRGSPVTLRRHARALLKRLEAEYGADQ